MKPINMAVSTPFGKRGRYWSCNKDANGNGVHTGDDFAIASGTRLVAAIAGTIRHRNYGKAFGSHQFAISPSQGQPFAAGEVFYAHTRTRLPDGTEVQMGDFVAESGAEGNVSGPHLHFEYHPNHKGHWSCGECADPQPIYDHQAATPPPSGGNWTSGDVYQNKLVPGQMDSDSVRRLQRVLNDWSFKGGRTLPITGNYLEMTQHEVGLFQDQICHDPADGAIGPKQTDVLFQKLGPWNIIR